MCLLAQTYPLGRLSDSGIHSVRSIRAILIHSRDQAVKSLCLPALRAAAATLDDLQAQNDAMYLLIQFSKVRNCSVNRWKTELLRPWNGRPNSCGLGTGE